MAEFFGQIALWGNDPLGEDRDTIELTVGLNPYALFVASSVEVCDVEQGDLLHVGASFQVTNDLPINVMICSMVLIGSGPLGNVGPIVCPANGHNFRSDVHYATGERVGWWRAYRAYQKTWVNLILYAASSAASGGEKLKLNKGYGRVWVEQKRKIVV